MLEDGGEEASQGLRGAVSTEQAAGTLTGGHASCTGWKWAGGEEAPRSD